MSGLRVAVVGGGLGGLCLAQGLRRAGTEVTVYERDHALASRQQGYRLHMDARAGLALRRCLPPGLFDLFLATCSRPSRRFTVLSDRLRVLHEMTNDSSVDPYAAATLSTSVNRGTLREILVSGLDVRFGHDFVRYEAGEDTVRLHLANGAEADADLVVGADGVHSMVRRQYLPFASVVDTGSLCIYGRTPLTASTLERVPAPMLEGFTAVIGGRVGMAAGAVRLRQHPELAAIGTSVRLSPVDDYLMWAVTAQQGSFPPPLREREPAALHDIAMHMIRSWHPDVRALVSQADRDATFLVRIRTSVPVPAWQPSRVTLLGDAIHAMSPARGSGANTALQDAGVLCEALTSVDPAEVVSAVGQYEEQMRDYGYAAVRASREAESDMGARRNKVLFWLYRRLSRAGA